MPFWYHLVHGTLIKLIFVIKIRFNEQFLLPFCCCLLLLVLVFVVVAFRRCHRLLCAIFTWLNTRAGNNHISAIKIPNDNFSMANRQLIRRVFDSCVRVTSSHRFSFITWRFITHFDWYSRLFAHSSVSFALYSVWLWHFFCCCCCCGMSSTANSIQPIWSVNSLRWNVRNHFQ